MQHLFLFLFISTLAGYAPACFGQKNKARSATTKSFKQGIAGKVEFWSGNFMPTVADPKHATQPPQNSIKPVKRKLLFFAPPLQASITTRDGMFVTTKQLPSYTTWSGTHGRYRLPCPAGTYTVLVQEPDGKLFCNSEDANGVLCPVKVEPKKWITFDIKINYEAVY